MGRRIWTSLCGRCVVPDGLNINQQIRQPYILGVVVVLTSLHPECTGHVALAATRGTGDKDVPVISDVLATGKPFYQILGEYLSAIFNSPIQARYDCCSTRLDRRIESMTLAVLSPIPSAHLQKRSPFHSR